MEKNVFKFLWKYISQIKFLFVAVLLCIFCGEVFFRMFMYYGSQIVDVISAGDPSAEPYHKALVLVGLSTLMMVFHRISYDSIIFFEAKSLPVYVSYMYKDLFFFTHKHSTAFFSEEMAGNVSNKVKTIVDNGYDIYFHILWGFIYPVFSVSLTLFFVADIHLPMAMFMLLMNVIYVLVVYHLSKKISPYSEARANKNSEAQGMLVDSITNAGLVKSFSNYLYEKRRFFSSVKSFARAERVETMQFGKLYLAQGIVRAAVQIAFVFLPVYYWYKGEITVGQFVLIQSLVYSLTGVYLHFTQSFMQFFKHYGGIKDGLELLSKPYDIVDVKGAKKLDLNGGDIEFNNILYHYKGTEPLFENFNLTIKQGEKVGLVGHSGAGKSTLVKILSRYYDVQKGEILIGQQNIAKVTQDSLREAIALIPQDPSLFNRTIMENIRYGNLKATDEDVFEAAKKAFCHDFISKLPQGYQSKVGERGVMLSGGERQRIAIARAILKNAPILILDEATSALDSESEKFIQESLKTLMQGKTVIAVAHRLSTLREMDKLVVMDSGQIVEQGSHTSLVRKKGVYYNFYSMQSQGFLAQEGN
ncbi:MAG: ABC transporter ATP-binding protein [Alphaproteobacteria bacterium]|nr:ABC transporter ATP-binding protein [Alphaproteobacteria bacterium]